MDSDEPVKVIASPNATLQEQAIIAVNILRTIRNWVIGGYIAEYELKGSDRSVYGYTLFSRFSNALTQKGFSQLQ